MTDGGRSKGPTIVKIGRSTSGEETNLVIRLRRNETGQPWGFRMLGGRDQGSCLYIHKVNPRSIADRSGLRVGDGLLAISGMHTNHMTHDQAKMEILRAGNELDFYIQRNAMSVNSETVKRQRSIEESRAEIIEDPSVFDTGYQNPNVQSRSFRIIQEALSYETPDDVAIVRYRESNESVVTIPELNMAPSSSSFPGMERGKNMQVVSKHSTSTQLTLNRGGGGHGSIGQPQICVSTIKN